MLILINPTGFESVTRLLIEDAKGLSEPLGDVPMRSWRVVTVPAGSTVAVPLQAS